MMIKIKRRGNWILADISDWLALQPNPSIFKLRWQLTNGSTIVGKVAQPGWHFLAKLGACESANLTVTATDMTTGQQYTAAYTPIKADPLPPPIWVDTLQQLRAACQKNGAVVGLRASLDTPDTISLANDVLLDLGGHMIRRINCMGGMVIKMGSGCVVANGTIATDTQTNADRDDDYARNKVPVAFWVLPHSEFVGAWNVDLDAVLKGWDLSNGVEGSIWYTREVSPRSIVMYHGWFGGGKYTSIVDVKQYNSPQEHGFRGGLWHNYTTFDGGYIGEGDVTLSGVVGDIRKSAVAVQAGSYVYLAGTVIDGPSSWGPLNGGDGGGKYQQTGLPAGTKPVLLPPDQWQWTKYVVLDGVTLRCTGTETARFRHGLHCLTGWNCTFDAPDYHALVIEPAGKFETRSKYGADAFDYRNVDQVQLIDCTFKPGKSPNPKDPRRAVDLGQGDTNITMNGRVLS